MLSAATGHDRYRGEGLKRITRDEIANGTFWSEGVDLEWVAEGQSARSGSTEQTRCTLLRRRPSH